MTNFLECHFDDSAQRVRHESFVVEYTLHGHRILNVPLALSVANLLV